MKSKERIIATIKREPVDHLPLCFEGIGHQSVEFINRTYPDDFERMDFYLSMDVDAGIRIGPPLFAGTETREWTEQVENEEYPLMVKEYITPKGTLRQVIRKHEYPFESVSIFSDFHVPSSRSVKFLVEKEEDLDKLEYILRPLNDAQIKEFHERARIKKDFCDKKQIIFAGYLQGVGDPIMWMSGIDITVLSSVTDPGFFERYVEIVSKWNLRIMEILLDAGVDLIIRRGWYESADFWSPDLFRKFLFKPLKQEIDIAHQAGVFYTYVMNSAVKPMIEIFKDLRFDIHSNLDPVTAGMDLSDIKRELGDILTFYGGVNNFLVIENGSEEDVRRAVVDAVEKLSPGGGFILGTGDVVDYMMVNPEVSKRNVYKMIEVWKELW